MAPQWEIEFGMGMGMGMQASEAAAAPAYIYGMPSAAETLRVDELLDFSTHHDQIFSSSSSSSSSVAADANVLPAAQHTAADGCGNSARYASFADDIYIPSDEVAELEWLSKFVEDSFSDMPFHYSLAPEATIPPNATTTHRSADASSAVVRGARSKRSRESNAASAWSSTLTPSSSSTASSSSSSSSTDFPTDFPTDKGSGRKKQGCGAEAAGPGGVARRCTHCASEKTPQWRTGPLGAKTLCNACGVRFKSGRLVPEYRPAASPTFVPAQHSNSHRKVVELRRQKELLMLRRGQDGAAVAAAEMPYRDYGVY